MKKSSIVAIAISALMVANVYAEGNPKFKQGIPYPKVKAELIKAGWVAVPQKNECGLTCDSLRSKGIKEVEDCADSGVMPCVFIFKNPSGKTVGVITQGEDFAFKAYR